MDINKIYGRWGTKNIVHPDEKSWGVGVGGRERGEGCGAKVSVDGLVLIRQDRFRP